MPTRMRHRHRVGHGPCSTRLLTLGLALIAALPLSACGPTRKRQLTVEPAGASTTAGPSSSDTPSTTPTPTPSATSSATAWTAPNVTISNDTTGTWHRQDDILERPVATSSEISQAYNFDAGGCLAIIFYKANQTIHDEGRRGGDNLSSSTEVQETMSNHSSFSSAPRTNSPPPIHGTSSCSRHEWQDSMLGPWDK